MKYLYGLPSTMVTNIKQLVHDPSLGRSRYTTKFGNTFVTVITRSASKKRPGTYCYREQKHVLKIIVG